jgi:hypothetical protein
MANKFLPHLFVLPEDDANRQVATGFELNLSSTRQVRVLTEAGGWARVCEAFVSDHISAMEKYEKRFMILLVDFDGKTSRLDHVKAKIPEHLQDRVFVLGAFSTPEALRQAGLGSYEEIGSKLADDCRNGTQLTWGHSLLQHNEAELDRLRESVCGFLFLTRAKAAT